MAYNWIQRLRVGQSERKDFYGVLASMTSSKSRIQIRNALSEMRDSLLKYKQPLGPFVDEALRRMAGHDKSREEAVGRLGGALKGMVPASEAALIIGAEERGEIYVGLRQAMTLVGAMDGLANKVRSALSLSMIYLIAILGMYAFFGIDMFPELAKSVNPSTWSKSAKFANWIGSNIVFVSAGIFGFALCAFLFFKFLIRNWTGGARDFCDDHVWPFTTARMINLSGLFMGISGFLGAGIPFRTAIEHIQSSSTPYMAEKLERVLQSVKRGETPYVSLIGSRIVPNSYIWLVQCYGKTPDFAVAVQELSDQFLKYAVDRTEQMAKVLNMAFMCFTAANIALLGYASASVIQAVR